MCTPSVRCVLNAAFKILVILPTVQKIVLASDERQSYSYVRMPFAKHWFGFGSAKITSPRGGRGAVDKIAGGVKMSLQISPRV